MKGSIHRCWRCGHFMRMVELKPIICKKCKAENMLIPKAMRC